MISSVTVEGSIELCDGCPSFVESDLDYWIDVVSSYCPWSSEVMARECSSASSWGRRASSPELRDLVFGF